jgi:hypothetical protein
MSYSRRKFIAVLLTALTPAVALARPVLHRRPRVFRHRRFHRRRIRRRVLWRAVRGRRLLVVPFAVVAGWELFVDNKVVVVKEVHEHRIIVEHADGSQQSIEVVKEDTEGNTQDLQEAE